MASKTKMRRRSRFTSVRGGSAPPQESPLLKARRSSSVPPVLEDTVEPRPVLLKKRVQWKDVLVRNSPSSVENIVTSPNPPVVVRKNTRRNDTISNATIRSNNQSTTVKTTKTARESSVRPEAPEPPKPGTKDVQVRDSSSSAAAIGSTKQSIAMKTTKTVCETSDLPEAPESAESANKDVVVIDPPSEDGVGNVDICPDYPMKVVRMDLEEDPDWHILTISNDAGRRVAWAIQAKNKKRLSFEPDRGILEEFSATAIKMIIQPFDKAEKLRNDEITVKWMNVPEGGEKFKMMWFKGEKAVRKKSVPVTYIE